MQIFLLALSAVVPLAVYMAVGRIVRIVGILDVPEFKKLNTLSFKLLIPLTLFFNIYKSDISSAVEPVLFIQVFLAILLFFFITWMIAHRSGLAQPDADTMTQGIFRSNYVLFGTTIAASLCGQEGLALVCALAAVVVPTVNALSVILFEIGRGGKLGALSLLRSVLKNPILDGGLLGIAVGLSGLRIPELLAVPLENLADAATPLALVTLGGLLSLSSMRRHGKWLAWACAGRLVFIPVTALAAFYLFGWRGDALVAVLAIFGSPTAVASAPMAQSMGGNGDLAGEIVAVTSIGCLFSLFVLIVALLRMGLIGM